MNKRRVRLIAIAVVLFLILALLAGYFLYYRATKRLSFNLTAGGTEGSIQPPEFFFAFSGTGVFKLQRPIGIDIVDEKVYVVDAVRHTIFQYDLNGRQTGYFGTTDTVTPLYIAENPKDKNLYVTDRRKRAVLKFDPNGAFLGEFDPKLPKKQLPKFDTGGVQWAPIAIGFADDGTMYVTDVLKGHRLLIFDPSGKFKRSVGDLGVITDPTQSPNVFQFPNGVTVVGNEVYVSDSNNRRIQVFDKDGNFLRFVVTAGLPRGVVSLLPFPSDPATTTPIVRLAVVDTLAHFVTIWDGATGAKFVNFGEQGTLEGQFSYPDGIARAARNRLFITDTANGRVEVWGWPDQVAALPLIGAPSNLLWCLLPFLLLPLLLLLRKRRFFATAEFVERMIDLEQADLMPHRRRAWIALERDYDLIKEMQYGDIDFGQLFEVTEYSESDARALIEKYEIDEITAQVLSTAQRAHVFCNEDTDYRRLAKILEIDVVDATEFVKRFAKKSGRTGDASTPPSAEE